MLAVFILSLTIGFSYGYECIDKYAKLLRIDKYLLYAIYIVESKLHPYAVHWKGRSHFFGDKRRAAEFVRYLWSKGESFDVGLGQINSENLRRWGVNPVSALEPCFNVYLSAVVLSDCMRKYGRTTRALDCYNKGKKARYTSSYVFKVLSVYRKLKR